MAVYGVRGTMDILNNKNSMLYRVVNNSMSNHFTKRLIDDNALFYRLIEDKYIIPDEIIMKAKLIGYRILLKSYFKLGELFLFLKYLYFYIRAYIICLLIIEKPITIGSKKDRPLVIK